MSVFVKDRQPFSQTNYTPSPSFFIRSLKRGYDKISVSDQAEPKSGVMSSNAHLNAIHLSQKW